MVVSVLLRNREWPSGLREIHARFCRAHLAAGFAEVDFDDATFDRSAAAFKNPDHVAIAIHNYRWRIGIAAGEPKYDDLEKRLAKGSVISVPTITLEGDANGAPHAPPAAYRRKFSGKYEHRDLTGGVGHNLPQEAPQAFAQAVVDVDSFS
jgi:pimeloyl-ACP methyl ester carboxylesterase